MQQKISPEQITEWIQGSTKIMKAAQEIGANPQEMCFAAAGCMLHSSLTKDQAKAAMNSVLELVYKMKEEGAFSESV